MDESKEAQVHGPIDIHPLTDLTPFVHKHIEKFHRQITYKHRKEWRINPILHKGFDLKV